MARDIYPLTPSDCHHRSQLKAELAGDLVYLVCRGCGTIRKVWGKPVTAARLAAAGMGQIEIITHFSQEEGGDEL